MADVNITDRRAIVDAAVSGAVAVDKLIETIDRMAAARGRLEEIAERWTEDRHWIFIALGMAAARADEIIAGGRVTAPERAELDAWFERLAAFDGATDEARRMTALARRALGFGEGVSVR